jgi:hypothetical protein
MISPQEFRIALAPAVLRHRWTNRQPGQWDGFDHRWGIITSAVPGPFHATDCDCNPPRGVFKGWAKDRCDKLMQALVLVIRSCHLVGFGSVVPVLDYRAVFPGSSEYDPYYLALRHAFINMATIAARVAPSFGSDGIPTLVRGRQHVS